MAGRNKKGSKATPSSKKGQKSQSSKSRVKKSKLPPAKKEICYESDDSGVSSNNNIQDLLDAASSIGDHRKRKGTSKRMLVVPTNSVSGEEREDVKANVEPAVLQALGADDLNEAGKKELDHLMKEYDPKVLNALFVKIAHLQKFRNQAKENETGGSGSQNNINNGSQSQNVTTVSQDHKTPLMQSYQFTDYIYPFMMMPPPQMYYPPLMQNYQQPTTSQDKQSSIVMSGTQTSTIGCNSNIETSHGQASKDESELVVMQSNFQNVPITQATTTYQGVTTETSASNIPYAVPDSMGEKVNINHTVSSSKGVFKNTDISVNKKPFEHVNIGAVEDMQEKDGMSDTFSDDSNISAEFPVPKQKKPGEEILTDSLSKYMSSSPRHSFMNFVDNINDSSKDITVGSVLQLNNDRMSTTEIINDSKPTSEQSKCNKELQTKRDVVVISDDDTDNVTKPSKDGESAKDGILEKQTSSSQDVQVGKIYHNLLCSKKINQDEDYSKNLNFPAGMVEKAKSNLQKRLMHLMSTDPSLQASLLRMILANAKKLPGKRPAAEPLNTSERKLPRLSSDMKFSSNLNYSDRGKNNAKTPGLSKLYLQDEDGDIMLHIAIAKEDVPLSIDIIKKMRGSHLDTINKLGQTPLHMGLYVQKNDIIRELLHNGADPCVLDGYGNSVIHIACEENSIGMLRCLFEFSEVHRVNYLKIMKIKNYQGLAALHIALYKRHDEIITELIEYGADLDVQDERSGATILVTAIQQRNWDLANSLIRKGADVNLPTYAGYYPLHFAANACNMPLVKLLLSYEAEIGSKTVEYEGNDSRTNGIKVLLDKEMRKRRRKRNLQQNNY